MSEHHLVAVCGGIGSGKSVVCRMLSSMGFEVYDCDSRARSIMDADEGIKKFISSEICADAISDSGEILRSRLAEVVFSDAEALNKLNERVHCAVREDVRLHSLKHELMFVETAILYQSQLDKMVDCVWTVDAPVDVRVRRVMRRNAMTDTQVRARIASQVLPDGIREHERTYTIVNDGATAVLPQLLELIYNEFEIVGIHPWTEL